MICTFVVIGKNLILTEIWDDIIISGYLYKKQMLLKELSAGILEYHKTLVEVGWF